MGGGDGDANCRSADEQAGPGDFTAAAGAATSPALPRPAWSNASTRFRRESLSLLGRYPGDQPRRAGWNRL